MPHTPGPWKIVYGGFRHDDGFAIGSDSAAASRVKVVAECWPCTIVDQGHRDELLANAKLIAAAPCLLESLRNLVGLAELNAGNLHQYKAAMDDARAVIAKANPAKQ